MEIAKFDFKPFNAHSLLFFERSSGSGSDCRYKRGFVLRNRIAHHFYRRYYLGIYKRRQETSELAQFASSCADNNRKFVLHSIYAACWKSRRENVLVYTLYPEGFGLRSEDTLLVKVDAIGDIWWRGRASQKIIKERTLDESGAVTSNCAPGAPRSGYVHIIK